MKFGSKAHQPATFLQRCLPPQATNPTMKRKKKRKRIDHLACTAHQSSAADDFTQSLVKATCSVSERTNAFLRSMNGFQNQKAKVQTKTSKSLPANVRFAYPLYAGKKTKLCLSKLHLMDLGKRFQRRIKSSLTTTSRMDLGRFIPGNGQSKFQAGEGSPLGGGAAPLFAGSPSGHVWSQGACETMICVSHALILIRSDHKSGVFHTRLFILCWTCLFPPKSCTPGGSSEPFLQL